MTDWVDVPEPMAWALKSPVTFGSMTYTQVVLRAPTSEEVMKAGSVRGASNIEVTLRLIEAVSAVPYDVLKAKLPEWVIHQMADYFEEFAGAPAPDPLEQWRAERRIALQAQALSETALAEARAKVAAEAIVAGETMPS